MGTPDYARFVQDCIAADGADDHGLTEDQMYGLYLSWCMLQGQQPAPCESFQAAMSNLGLRARRHTNHRYIRPGLRMTGPAAIDYILATRSSLL